MLKKLSDERAEKLKFITSLTEEAMAASRDLSENESELITRGKERIAVIDKQLETLSGDLELSQAAQDRLAKLSGAVQSGRTETAVEYPSAGAYLRDYLSTVIGVGSQRSEADERLRRYHRAAAHVTTDAFAGIFPNSIVGPVINFINSSRPLVNALGVQGVPSGPTFRRPRLVDTHTADGVGIQAAQKDELVSQPFSITSDDVSLSTLGGYVNVARQVLDWGVASMDTIVNQLAARYAMAVERAAITEMQKSTSKVTLAANADGPTLVKAIFDGAAKVFTQTNQLPTIMAAGPLGWARLGSIPDLAGRQIFPFLSPSNAAGSMGGANTFSGNPVGLSLVVTPGITDDTFWILNGWAMEAYEQLVGQLQVTEPSVLGVQVAYAGYVGFFRPAADGAVHLAP